MINICKHRVEVQVTLAVNLSGIADDASKVENLFVINCLWENQARTRIAYETNKKTRLTDIRPLTDLTLP